MNRKNFLALLPSLAAAPFIAKEIIKMDKEIIIVQPEEMKEKIKESIGLTEFNYDRSKMKVLIVQDDTVIAEGRPDEFLHHNAVYDNHLNPPMVYGGHAFQITATFYKEMCYDRKKLSELNLYL